MIHFLSFDLRDIMAGGILGGSALEKFGRKTTILGTAIPFIGIVFQSIYSVVFYQLYNMKWIHKKTDIKPFA